MASVKRFAHQKKNREEIIRSVDTDEFRRLIAKLSPDLLLIDVEAHEYIMAASVADVRIALISVFFNLWKQKGNPPLNSFITPGNGWKGTFLGLECAWLTFRIRNRLYHLIKHLRTGGIDRLSLLREYADHVSFDLSERASRDQWLIPLVYGSVPTVYLTASELEFEHRPSPDTYYIGPMISVRRSYLEEGGLPQTARKAELVIQSHRPKQASRRLILCSFGSYFSGDDKCFWKKLSVVASSRPEWDMIFALGSRFEMEELHPLPENVHCFDWAPQMEILAAADCAVIHGGLSTIHECIHHRVPMVIYPFDVNDQYGNAARVAYHSLGVVGDRLKDQPDTILTRIEQVISSQVISSGLAGMHDAFERYRTENRAVKMVESLIGENG